MADKLTAKFKLDQLAERVKGRATTAEEYSKLTRAIDADRIKSRGDISQVLGESLNRSASDIGTALASDDGDRLADEIISLLKG